MTRSHPDRRTSLPGNPIIPLGVIHPHPDLLMDADPLLSWLAVADVDQHVHPAHERARGVTQRRRERHEGDARSIGSLGNCAYAPDRSVLFQRHGHWALIMGQRRTVRLI